MVAAVEMYHGLEDERTAVAITDGNGNVVERYVYDGLGNAQALDSSGNPYPVSTTSGDANWQFQEQFSGSTFDASTQLLTAEGTHYSWNILYHGQMYDGIPGVYETANGVFNPREQALLAPNLGAIQQGISAYDPTAGETGFNGWYDRNANTIAGLSETGLGLAGIYLTGGLAELASPFISSALGLSGTAAASAASVAEETSGTVGALEDWEGANAAARLAARDAAFETDNAVGTAANVESNVKQSVVIAKATLGAISGGISGFTGSAADHGTLAEDLISGGFGAFFGAAAGGAGATLQFGWLTQAAVSAAGAIVANTFSQGAEYGIFGRHFDLGEVAAAGAAGFATPLVSGSTIVGSIIGEEAPAFEVYATGLPTAVWEGIVRTGLENPSLLYHEAGKLYGGE